MIPTMNVLRIVDSRSALKKISFSFSWQSGFLFRILDSTPSVLALVILPAPGFYQFWVLEGQ